MARKKLVYVSPTGHVRVHFELDRKGFRKIAVNDELQDSCNSFVRAVALPYAKSISPRSQRAATPAKPHYQDSFQVKNVKVGTKPPIIITPRWPLRRVGSQLVNVSPQALIVEKGPGVGTGHQVLTKTLAYIGSLGSETN